MVQILYLLRISDGVALKYRLNFFLKYEVELNPSMSLTYSIGLSVDISISLAFSSKRLFRN